MDILNGLMLGLESALNPVTLLYCFIGVFLGTLIGVLPGIGALAAISLLLPITYHIPPTAAIVMLAGVYYGAQYGGSTASILLNLPGTPSSAVACLDGYPMAKQGRAGVALFMTTIASFVGSMLGILALVLFSPAIAELGLKFGAAEYFAMMLLGLIAASALASGSPAKGLSMVVLGLLLGTVGTDVNSGQARFDFGIPELMDGINLVALAMGVFGISEVISGINQVRGSDVKEKITLRTMTPTRKDVKDSIMPMLRGTGIGSFFGALPGTGASIASFMSYAVEKKIAKDPSRFGNGAIEGVTAPEAANNAAAQTAFVPTLSLGIPGDAVMALMLGALIIHGIQPGPMLMSQQPDLFWGLIVSFGIGNIMLLVLNLPMIGLWVAILRIPYRVLFPAILVFISLGVYSVNNNTFDVLMVAAIGAMGYLLAVFKFEAAPLLLGFVLGPLMEENLRRALLLSRGELSTFIERPISAGFLAFGAAILLWSAWGSLKEFMRAREKEADAQQV
ncbi:MAG: tripartite tricarboxylate transporter permease [Hydrogenophaga sp.]|jgi:TctA family transporter|uniref:tripartite tricarboxylate transporter permease n=1 Tax=Hydrogenophaga sp. TaxID=1904254 RepID=UPI002720CF6B|nr:tripartite tricarboxylate transporter permease [Hydrogenophaga sp.]MDO9481215.1 tripartite tricarboxylate transporter permease [Hydrogenophaga sp.]MDP3343479.1 tripartite tricarboxylate transporter permease [Hydrogenophaga sp.]MDP3806949.1 tripartite tricarboxylate transporter permease [Hydrogenophaga sp.]MDP3923242.1 tripartite tricarboxylate transporter permease [Hydrogenophaga sp.]MDZ4130371.1 tripartite tricarboxylate transporter permease [Hydrogenophaga sp.]